MKVPELAQRTPVRTTVDLEGLPDSSSFSGVFRPSVRVEKGKESLFYMELRPKAPPIVTEAAKKEPLAIPRQLLPTDRAVFDQFPRSTKLEWSPVAGAARYRLQVQLTVSPTSEGDWFDHPDRFEATFLETYETSYTIEFAGAQPGRWRVWAIDDFGRESLKSPWWIFEYLR